MACIYYLEYSQGTDTEVPIGTKGNQSELIAALAVSKILHFWTEPQEREPVRLSWQPPGRREFMLKESPPREEQ